MIAREQDSRNAMQTIANMSSSEAKRVAASIADLEWWYRLLSNTNLILLGAAGVVALLIAMNSVANSRVGDKLLKAKDAQLRNELDAKDRHILSVDAEAKKEAARIEGEAKKHIADVEEATKERIAKVESEAGIKIADASRKASEADERAKQAALETEHEKLARLELEKALAPRELPLIVYADGTSNIDLLRRFAGTEALVEYIPDFEAARTAGNVVWLLEQAGWKIISAKVSTDFMFNGVTFEQYMPTKKQDETLPEVEARGAIQAASGNLAHAAAAVFVLNDWDARRGWTSRGEIGTNQVRVRVGFKTPPVSLNPEMKKMMADAKERAIREFGAPPPPDKMRRLTMLPALSPPVR